MKMEAAADKESSIKAVRAAMDAFLAKWAGLGEQGIHDYFKKEWSPRIGMNSSSPIVYASCRRYRAGVRVSLVCILSQGAQPHVVGHLVQQHSELAVSVSARVAHPALAELQV